MYVLFLSCCGLITVCPAHPFTAGKTGDLALTVPRQLLTLIFSMKIPFGKTTLSWEDRLV
jgi:hypothetical protein